MTKPSFTQDMIMVVVGCVAVVLMVAFMTVPHDISMHFGQTPQSSDYHLT